MARNDSSAGLTGGRLRFVVMLCAAGVMLVASGCARVEQAVRTITLSGNLHGDELSDVFRPGRRFSAVYEQGGIGIVGLRAGGALTVDQDGRTASGTWLIADDRFCANWNRARLSGQRCYRAYGRVGDSGTGFRLFGPNGAHEVDMTLIGGE